MVALELRASYGFASAEADLAAFSHTDLRTIRRLADVLPVHASDGIETVGLTKKMLESLGCPTWDSFITPNEEEGTNPEIETANGNRILGTKGGGSGSSTV